MPTILIMMLLKMGPWAEKPTTPEDTKYVPVFTSRRPDRWYETWWAAIGFVFLVLGVLIGMAYLLGWLMLMLHYL